MIRTNSQHHDTIEEKTGEVPPLLLSLVAVLHEHASMLRTLPDMLQLLLSNLGQNPFPSHGDPLIEEVADAFREPLKRLESSLQAVSTTLSETRRQEWEALRTSLRAARGMGPELAAALPGVRRSATSIVTQLSDRIELSESERTILNAGKEFLRLMSITDILRIESRLVEVWDQTRGLRDVLLSQEKEKERPREVRLAELVRRAVDHARVYAESRRIDLRLQIRSDDTLVVARQTDVQRALSNLLSNAIKYSYTLHGKNRAWITILVTATPKFRRVDIESWGVPIAEDEIRDGRIFRPGYRGRHAYEEGRTGSGVGLWDAHETATTHGGRLTVTSVPTPGKRIEPGTRVAYITHVILELPAQASQVAENRIVAKYGHATQQNSSSPAIDHVCDLGKDEPTAHAKVSAVAEDNGGTAASHVEAVASSDSSTVERGTAARQTETHEERQIDFAKSMASKLATTSKPINRGQTRKGVLKRDHEGWYAQFEGDNRRALITNIAQLASDVRNGQEAEFYILEQSKSLGIRTRFERRINREHSK